MDSSKQLAFLWLFEDDPVKETEDTSAVKVQKKSVEINKAKEKTVEVEKEIEEESIIKKFFTKSTTEQKEENDIKLPASGMGDYVLVLSIFLSLALALVVRFFKRISY